MRKLCVMALGITSLAMLAGPAQAAPITGVLNITGSAQVSATTINWVPTGSSTGVFATVAPGSDYFADIFNPGVVPVYSGTAIDLTAATVFPLANFLSGFVEDPEVPSEYDDLSFTLAGVLAPAATPCNGTEGLGDTCSLGAFTLSQTVNGVDVGFDVAGWFIDPTFEGPGSPLNTAIGLYTTQVSNATIQSIIATLDAGGSITTSFSAEYTATAVPNEVPEPASMLLLGTGLAGFAAARRRRNKK